MDWIQLHVIFNHLPVMGIPIATVFLGIGLWKKEAFLTRTALGVLAALCFSIIVIYQVGDKAEHQAKALGGFSEAILHEHEEAAEFGLVLGLITGFVALAGACVWKNSGPMRFAPKVSFGLAILTSVTLAQVAHRGGKMRHGDVPGELPYPYLYTSPQVVPEGMDRDSVYKMNHENK